MNIIEFFTNYWQIYLFIGYWFSVDRYTEIQTDNKFFESEDIYYTIASCLIVLLMWPTRLIGMIRDMSTS